MMDEKSIEQVASIIAMWQPVIGSLILLGVKSFSVIHAAMQDAGVADDAVIAALRPKWDELYDRVKLQAGG